MLYLRPLVKRITKDKNIITGTNGLKTDKEILDYLLKTYSIESIQDVFFKHYGIKFTDLKFQDVDLSLIKKLGLKSSSDNNVVPISYDEKNKIYHFASSDLADRNSTETIKSVCAKNGEQAEFSFALQDNISEVYKKITQSKTDPNKMGKPGDIAIEEDEDFNATKWVEDVLNKGIDYEASDIHIERLKDGLQTRYRVDGKLIGKMVFELSETAISNIYVRLKIVSNMDIVEKRRGQGGRIDSYERNDKLYDMRVSTVNTIYGEKFVMRIFDKENSTLTLEEAGFNEENKNKVLEMLKHKNGIIYLAGATGSGKTTTLYSMIEELNNDNVNIYTIEDPIEKTINNINQIQINRESKMSYPTVLQTLLRQDPDVIIVGETRDGETAELSVRASLTGHLVITTLHANSATDVLSRLSDMGVEDYLIGASSVGFMSQRLVGVLCPHCKEKVEKLQDHEDEWIKSLRPNFNYAEEKEKDSYIYKPVGCDKCQSGYKGRIAIIETIIIDDKLRSMISKRSNPEQVLEYLLSIGYKTMAQDGLDKMLQGKFGVEELLSKI